MSIDFSRKGRGHRVFASQPTISLRETSYSLPCQDIRQVRFVFVSFILEFEINCSVLFTQNRKVNFYMWISVVILNRERSAHVHTEGVHVCTCAKVCNARARTQENSRYTYAILWKGKYLGPI